MDEQEENISDQKLEEFERYNREFVQPAVNRAERAYGQILTRLWTANGAASLASVSFVGGVWHESPLTREMLIPLGFFLAGLISMAIGAMLSLHWETKLIRSRERATTVRQHLVDHIRSPSETVGLKFGDSRTWTAYIAAACFAVGLVAGLSVLWFYGPATGSG